MTKSEQVLKLRNRHVGRLLTKISEVMELPALIESAIKTEFTYFSEDVVNQVLVNNKENSYETELSGNH